MKKKKVMNPAMTFSIMKKPKVEEVPNRKNKVKVKDCHEVTEIVPGLFLCNKKQATKLYNFVDVLVPLDSLDPDVWELDFEGEIKYIPIFDYCTLPINVAKKKALEIIEDLKTKSVAIFCIGGHGRTGYFASIILGLMGYEDPIEFIRENYCDSAIESRSQINQIGLILGKDFSRHSPASKWNNIYWFNYGVNYDTDLKKVLNTKITPISKNNICGDCVYYQVYNSKCYLAGEKILFDEVACEDFDHYMGGGE